MIEAPLLLLGVALYGVPLARAVDGRLRGFTLAGAGFLLGVGAVALHLFLLSVLGIGWSRTSVLLAMIPLLAGAIGFRRGFRRWRGPAVDSAMEPVPVGRSGWISRVLDALTLVVIASYAVFATWAPPYEWDFYGIWGLKARWFYEAGGMEWATVQTVSKVDYPLLMPLLFDFIGVFTKEWNDRAFGWIYVGLGVAVLAIARGIFARELRSPLLGALATLAIAFPTLNLWIGLAEGGVMAFGCAGLFFIRSDSMRLGAILLGLAAWSKNEGLALLAVSALAILVATRSVRRVVALWPAAVVIAPWMITRTLLDLRTDFMGGSMTDRVLGRLLHPGEVLQAFATSPPDQPWFWLVCALTFLLFLGDAWRRERFLLVAVVLQLGLFFAQALATTWDLAAHISLTLNRLPHQMAPATGFLAALLLLRNFAREERIPPA